MDKLITTSNSFDGYRITGYYGIISAEVTMPNKHGNVQENHAAYRVEACDKLMENLPAGANAVIGLRGETIPSKVIEEYSVIGTAVCVELLEE